MSTDKIFLLILLFILGLTAVAILILWTGVATVPIAIVLAAISIYFFLRIWYNKKNK
jgi:hypothetical protein